MFLFLDSPFTGKKYDVLPDEKICHEREEKDLPDSLAVSNMSLRYKELLVVTSLALTS